MAGMGGKKGSHLDLTGAEISQPHQGVPLMKSLFLLSKIACTISAGGEK